MDTLRLVRRLDQLWVVLGLLLLAVAVRWQTFANPVLGFDEQFYLLVGDQMVAHHALPYVDVFDRKPIGLFLIFAGARLLGGDGFVQYKLVALGFVVLTAYLIYRAALPISSRFAALVAAALSVIWLNFMEGEGGQAEVFYNPLMLGAALIVWHVFQNRRNIGVNGALAMLLVGVALQIKYTVIFEGIFFGLALIWGHYSTHRRVLALLPLGLVWIVCAWLPTALAALVYWRLGALQPFAFANFLSLFGRNAEPFSSEMVGLIQISGVLLPLALPAFFARNALWAQEKFALCWLIAALVGMIVFGSFLSPQYAMPLVAPLCLATAPFFARRGRGVVVGVAMVVSAFGASQVVLAHVMVNKGGAQAAREVAAAAQPHPGHCIYVYDGYPALYMLTHSCLPTRWVFPGHLNTQVESSARALGVDPIAEEKRILASRPETIIDDAPVFSGGNRATHALVLSALAHDYHLVLKYRTGHDRYRLVYRLNNAAL